MTKKEFPEIKEKNEGKFTKWVEKNMNGMDTCKAASKIMRSRTKKYSPAVVKMANYANNFGCKKKSGASFNPKLKKAVADGKIKGKFADAVMGASIKEPRGTKEENKKRKVEKIIAKQVKRAVGKTHRKYDKAENQYKKGKITAALKDEKMSKAREEEDKTMNRQAKTIDKRYASKR